MAEILTLRDAVKRFVNDGDTVALEGFTHLIPTAAGHEIIRQGKKELTLVRMTPDLIYDQLIGAGCARKLIFSWGGNPGVGSLHRLRDAVEKQWPQPLEIEEHSHADLANAYVSTGHAMMGVTLAPATALALTGLVLRGENPPVLAPFSAGRFARRHHRTDGRKTH